MSEVEELIRLAELASSRHDERRQYEWKVSLGFWALIAVASLKAKELPQLPTFVGAIVIVLYAVLWLRGVWVANADDKRLAQYYWKAAEAKLRRPASVLGDRPPPLALRSWSYWVGFMADWAMQFHLTVTVSVVVFFYYVQRS